MIFRTEYLRTGFYSPNPTVPAAFASEQLMQKWQGAGLFWKVGSENQKYPGNITFEPGIGITVVTQGTPLDPFGIEIDANIGTFLGTLSNGAKISLFECSAQVTQHYREKVYYETTLRSQIMIAGGHWPNAALCRLEEMYVNFSHIDRWFTPPFRLRHGRKFTKTLICFEPDELEAEFELDNIAGTLRTFCSRKIPLTGHDDNLQWTYRYRIILRPSSHQPIAWYLRAASLLRDMFVVLVGTGIYTLQMEAASELSQEGQLDTQVFLPVTIPRMLRLEKSYFSSSYNDVKAVIKENVASWFQNHRQFEVARNAYTELQCLEATSSNVAILRILQTLEHIHGIIFPSEQKYVTKPTFKAFTKWVEHTYPSELAGVGSTEMHKLGEQKSMIANRIVSLNELSFRDRLKMLFKDIPERRLYPILGNPPDIDTFLDAYLARVAATRNFLTHFNNADQRKSFVDGEIQEAAATCWAVLTYFLAHNCLGLSTEKSGDFALQAKRAMFMINRPANL